MLDGTFLSAKTFFSFFFFLVAEEWCEQFRISPDFFFFSLFKPADEMRVNPRTCGR